MSKEYADYDVLEFTSGGAKAYGMKMRHKGDGSIRCMLKLRGITLDHRTCQRLHYDSFVGLVKNYGEEGAHVQCEYPHKFGPKRDSQIVSQPVVKTYKPTCQKGIITRDWEVLPFGWCD